MAAEIHAPAFWMRLGIALVWLVFGLLFKALDAVPRHRQIVARVVGTRYARTVTTLVAMGETVLGLWMLYGRYLAVCVAIQTVALIVMNGLELRYARDLLLAPFAMICANIILLAMGWYVVWALN